MIEHQDSKAEFLVTWYDVLWRNIDRSMTSMWQVLAPITVVGTGLWALGQGHLPLWIGGSALLLIIIWALNLTIDLNSWHRRNLYLLTSVERQFFEEQDYGSLIPSAYRTPKRNWVVFYVVHGWTFGVLLVVASAYFGCLAFERSADPVTWLVLGAILTAGLVFTACHLRHDLRSERAMYNELFGNKNVQPPE